MEMRGVSDTQNSDAGVESTSSTFPGNFFNRTKPQLSTALCTPVHPEAIARRNVRRYQLGGTVAEGGATSSVIRSPDRPTSVTLLPMSIPPPLPPPISIDQNKILCKSGIFRRQDSAKTGTSIVRYKSMRAPSSMVATSTKPHLPERGLGRHGANSLYIERRP